MLRMVRLLSLGQISQIRLQAAFTPKDPKSVNIKSSHQCLFALLGSALVKAAIKMLVKLTPAVFFEPNDAVDENKTKEDAKK